MITESPATSWEPITMPAKLIENCPCCSTTPETCVCCCHWPSTWMLAVTNLFYDADSDIDHLFVPCSYYPIDFGTPEDQCNSIEGQFLLTGPEIVECNPSFPQAPTLAIWQSPVFEIAGLPANVEVPGIRTIFLEEYVWQIRCQMTNQTTAGGLYLILIPVYYLNHRPAGVPANSDTRCNNCLGGYSYVEGGDFGTIVDIHGCMCRVFDTFYINPDYLGNECRETRFAQIEFNDLNWPICNLPRQRDNPIRNITLWGID